MAERVTYVALSFFCLFFVGHGRENKDAPEGEGQVLTGWTLSDLKTRSILDINSGWTGMMVDC